MFGGIFYLLNELKVKNVIIGKQFEDSENLKKFLRIVKDKKIQVLVVEDKTRINIEKDLYFDILWPDSDKIILENSINNNAIVCNLFYKNFKMLFTGDIEKETEEILVSKYCGTEILKANILKVAHHGSKSSSTKNFLELVNPKIALIGVGKNNLYGHPNENVITRLESFRIHIYRTDEDGEIAIKVNSKGNIKISKFLN